MRWNKFGIALLAFVIALLSRNGAALNEDELVYENYTVNVGQVFTAKVHGDDIDTSLLPSWLQYNGTTVFGIPQLQKFYTVDGKEKVEIVHIGLNVYANITFLLAEKNVCGFDETIFLEVYLKNKFTNYTTKDISDTIQEFAVMMDLKPGDIRALPYKYLDLFREENNAVYAAEDDLPTDDVLAIVWVLGCGDFSDNEDLVNTVNVVQNNNYNFRIIQGYFASINLQSDEYLKHVDTSKLLLETTTFASLRTTRRADHPPKRINSLPSYECTQGKTCKLSIPPHTFIDEEPVENLQYTVFPMTHGKGFLNANYPTMEGVPLENGAFDFRLEARDAMKQAASAPFRVIVKAEAKTDFSFETLVDKDIKQINGTTTCKFIDRLANVLKLDGEKIRINSIQAGKGERQTTIRWSYMQYQSTNKCDTDAIFTLKRKISNKRGVPHQMFVKNMGQEVHVREVTLFLSGRCNTTATSASFSDSTSTTLLPNGKTTSFTDVKPTMESESMIPIYLVALIAIVILIVLLTVLILYCCMFKKGGKKGKNQLDYVTKGQPVVFPNELAADDDTPSVATPMLVKDERPPLQPNLDGTTIHENPLYKAPSVARTSISTATNGQQMNTATTFRQPSNNGNQRLPPPYVSP